MICIVSFSIGFNMYHVQLLDNLDAHHRLGFEFISRSLLILGEPGFGKTMTLVDLTRSLLELTGEDDI
jgi:DNA polymerase III delta prime subunit